MAPNANLGHGPFSCTHNGSKGEPEEDIGTPVNVPRVQVGLFWVGSRLKPSSTATLDQYHQYYNDELIPGAINFPSLLGPKTIVRYKNVSTSPPDNSFAFLTLSPERDLQLMHGPVRDRALFRTRGVPTQAFNGDAALQHIDFNNIGYRYLCTLEGELDRDVDSKRTDAYPLTMVADSFDAPDRQTLRTREEAAFTANYQLPKQIKACKHHLQSLEYKLLQGTAPRYLVIHFFDCDHAALGEDILTAGIEGCVGRQVYSLFHAQGVITYPPKGSNGGSCTGKKSASAKAATGLDWLLY